MTYMTLIAELLWFRDPKYHRQHHDIQEHIRASRETKHSLFHRGLVFGLSSVEPRPQHDLHVHHHVHVYGPFPLGASAGLVPRPESGDVALHGNATQTQDTSAETLHTSSHQVSVTTAVLLTGYMIGLHTPSQALGRPIGFEKWVYRGSILPDSETWCAPKRI